MSRVQPATDTVEVTIRGRKTRVRVTAEEAKRLRAERKAATGPARTKMQEPTSNKGASQTGPDDAPLDITKPVPEVLAWVGEDHDRARTAVEAEQARGEDARSTLIDPLQQLLGESSE